MKAGGCKDEFKVSLAPGVGVLHEVSESVTQGSCMQAWSKCVDDERQSGKDFTEECKDRVLPTCPRYTYRC